MEEKQMTPERLMQLLKIIIEVSHPGCKEQVDAFQEIINAAVNCHDDLTVRNILRGLFAQWIGDDIFYDERPHGEDLLGIFPTLVVCCCADPEIKWMYYGCSGWEADPSQLSAWSPAPLPLMNQIKLEEGLKVASYTQDDTQYDAIREWLQHASEELHDGGFIIDELFRQTKHMNAGMRAAFFQGQIPILTYLCVGTRNLRPISLFYE